MLSKVLGVKKIEDNLQHFKEQMKRSLTLLDLSVRLKVQKKVEKDLRLIGQEMELEIAKKYHTSKKSVYGIDNELHLVEQVQKSLHAMLNDNLLNDDLNYGGDPNALRHMVSFSSEYNPEKE
jgi:hypothetical protein